MTWRVQVDYKLNTGQQCTLEMMKINQALGCIRKRVVSGSKEDILTHWSKLSGRAPSCSVLEYMTYEKRLREPDLFSLKSRCDENFHLCSTTLWKDIEKTDPDSSQIYIVKG